MNDKLYSRQVDSFQQTCARGVLSLERTGQDSEHIMKQKVRPEAKLLSMTNLNTPNDNSIADGSNTVIKNNVCDEYVFIKCLRRTLFGHLQLRQRTVDGKVVAVKVCQLEVVESQRCRVGITLFEDPYEEARQMKTLPEHNNIVSYIDSFIVEESNQFWIVMEYASRGDLFDYISRGGNLSENVAKLYICQLISAIEHIHSHGVCHLDISLENIVLDAPGVLKVCDFGLSRRILPTGFTSSKPGKEMYMAPEVVSGSVFHGDVVDAFSVGVVVFVLLIGFPPFDKACFSDPRYALLSNQSDGLRTLVRQWKLVSVLPAGAITLLSKLLCPPENRISIRECLLDPWILDNRGL